jgi:hypothetical protein
LELEVSLELGAWNLELYQPLVALHRRVDPYNAAHPESFASDMHRPRPLLARLWQLPLRASAPHSSSNDRRRVQVQVDSEIIWFESTDSSLAQSTEAIGSALAIPAAAIGKKLAIESPVDAVWLTNAQRAQAIAADWWGYARPGIIADSRAATASLVTRRRTALCFTCGVDSFHSLLRGNHDVSHVIFVLGYDIGLADRQRAEAATTSVRHVAAELGINAEIIRTNLRTHGIFRTTNWEHTHGGALAAIGHLLSEHVDQLLISASYPRVFDRPWGSHWTLDPFWSSSAFTVAHVGAEKWRAEKLIALMDDPLVRRHLRVCWENRAPGANCGQCEKCLRTMLVLDGHGRLDRFPVFPAASMLAANLEQLNPLKQDLIRVYAGFLEMDLSTKVRGALTALVDRSARHTNALPAGEGGLTRA